MASFALYGSGPDALASQQMAYDQLYNASNVARARQIEEANARALQAALQQSAWEAAYAQRQDELGAAMAENERNRQFQAGENLLNRNYNWTVKNEADQEQMYNNALRVADWLPEDEAGMRRLYPGFSAERISRLITFAKAARHDRSQQEASENFRRFYVAAQQADKEGVPLTEDALASFNISKESPNYANALAIIKAINKPYEEQFKAAESAAGAGNMLARIEKDRAAIAANPTKTGYFSSWPFGAISRENVIEPNPEATARIDAIRTRLEPFINPQSKRSLVTVSPGTGELVPIVPRPPSMAVQPVPDAQIQQLRNLAQDWIRKGKDPAAVAKRFKELTGLAL